MVLIEGLVLNDIQRTVLLLTMPTCSTFNLKMQELANVVCETSDQHKATSKAQLSRDNMDVEKLLSCLDPISPFTGDDSLRNISTGVIADENVNVDKFYNYMVKH